jgi:hypothetical protein
VLTWERVYTLALVRRRAGGGALSEVLDAKALAEQAGRHHVADYARFRDDFSKGGAFRDPSGDFLALQARLLAVEAARANVAAHERLSGYLRERIERESSGLCQFELDWVEGQLAQARLILIAEAARYQDGLDALKVELGLSPHAPVVPDRESLAAFRDVFAASEQWSRDPNRVLTELPRLAGRLPEPGTVLVRGRPILDLIERDPSHREDVLKEASRVATRDRGGAAAPDVSDGRAELQVRRRIRHLLETRQAYEVERRRFILVLRQKDHAFERLIAPPPAASASALASRSAILKDVVEHGAEILGCQNRLVALWTSFRAERLALDRDLGVLPHADWASFYDQFKARRGGAVGEGDAATPLPPATVLPPVPPASPRPVAPPSPGQ